MNTQNETITNFESACTGLMQAFADKHELEHETDIKHAIHLGMCELSDYYVSFETMYFDLLTNADVKSFFQWYDYSMQGGEINYYSWCLGLRQENLKEHKKQSLAKSKNRVKEAKRVLFANINNDVFAEIIAKMNAEKITIAELARRMKRSHQQVSGILKSRNPTVKTLNNLKKALEL